MDIAGQIILSVLLAYGLSFFQYLFRKSRQRFALVLFLLRGSSYLALFLLLVNPKMTRLSYVEEKPRLQLVFDNSASIQELEGDSSSMEWFRFLTSDPDLNKRFQISALSFDKDWGNLDSLAFEGQDSRIDGVLEGLKRIYTQGPSAWVAITDGNQSEGRDYEFFKPPTGTRVHALVVGDTTKYEDLRIDYVEANRYTFLGNTFPVVARFSYSGNREVSTRVSFALNGRTVRSIPLTLGPGRSSPRIEEEFSATQVGPLRLTVGVAALDGERNTSNNLGSKRIEVIDERKRIAIVSSISHPDLGSIAHAIRSNPQREARIVSPAEALREVGRWDAFVLYQPEPSFGSLLQEINRLKKGYLMVTGISSRWDFINRVQDIVRKDNPGPIEDYTAAPGESWSAFNRDSIDIEAYPALKEYLGSYQTDPAVRVLLQQRIRRVSTGFPLFFLSEKDGFHRAFLLGEGIWQWRSKSYRDQRRFEAFDRTLGRVIRFVSESKDRNRLQIQIPDQIRERSPVEVRAVFFNPAFEVDPTAEIRIRVESRDRSFAQVYPFSFNGGDYTTSLEALEAGSYRYRVYVEGEELGQSGSFAVEPYEPETQWTRSNPEKLRRFAERSGGELFFPAQGAQLKSELLTDPSLAIVKERIVERRPLIDFILLLFILSGTLTAEWFVRKFNGLL